MKITYYGQNCFGLETDEISILTDPFITGNPLAKDKVDINDLKPHYIFLTHAHQDHTLDVEAIARASNAVVVCNYEIGNHFEEKGLTVQRLNHGGNLEFEFGTAKYVNAIHTSSFADGSYGGQPGGYVFVIDGKTVYMAGDTALTMDMKLIPMQFDVDISILPVGGSLTMGVDDAIIASDFVACDKVIGCHYDTWPQLEIDHEQARGKFEIKNKELILLEIGSALEL
ncbi:MAG: metal-dependent hydrolase [Cytophagaceae bacterium]|nr:metal-dependent hydrolase [Cytophagaceae bacterium]|tara:strand:+ start:966 stop:1646 length:681 start_codon:yes stop_codon:yes gene_type:complete